PETDQSSAASDRPEPDPQGKTGRTASPDLPLVAPSLSRVSRSRPHRRRITTDTRIQAQFFNKIRRRRAFDPRRGSTRTSPRCCRLIHFLSAGGGAQTDYNGK